VAKILVIEDDEQVCEMIAEALQTEGYETIQARDGRTGLEAARKQAPDLVLCLRSHQQWTTDSTASSSAITEWEWIRRI
jgi:DNA-binding response OmpR family regulator